MNDLVIVVLLVLVGFLARALLAERQCRCGDAARTTPCQGEDVSVPPLRDGAAFASVAAIAPELVAAPARITRVGY